LVGVAGVGAVQFMWYQRGRNLPEDLPEDMDVDRAIAPVYDPSGHVADLGEAGVALESLLDTDAADGIHREEEEAEALGVRRKRVSYQSTMSY
jgi:hypothetical protein